MSTDALALPGTELASRNPIVEAGDRRTLGSQPLWTSA
jgi:hypothetical protein